MWWQQIIIMIASYVISAMLAPKPKQKPAALEDIEFPQFEEGSPQEVFFGDVWTESWMVLGTGNFRTTKIKKSNGFGGSTTVGYKYYMGMLMGLCRGPVDEILEIQVGDRVAWTGSATTNATVAIDKPGLFGGKKREGGIVGAVNFLFGGPAQVPDPSIDTVTGAPVPGLRGVTTVWFDGYFAANSPYPKVWKFRARRNLKGWYGDAPWYPEKAIILLESGTVKAQNPAHIVYECLTNPLWARGFPATARLDDASFRATADKYYAENFGLCLRWTRQDSIRNFVQSVLDHAGAALYEDRVTGLIKLVAIRGDYVVGSLPLFTYDNGLLEVEDDDNGAQSVGVNEVIVQYRRAADNESRQVRVHNVGAMYGNGKIAQQVEYPGLPTHELATLAAQRDLRAGSGFLKRFRLRMDRRAYNSVPPAGVFRFSAADLDIAEMVVRIGSVEEGERDGALTVTVLQDHFSLDSTYYVSDEPKTFAVPAIDELPEGAEATSITVISQTLTAPPPSPADGDQYLVAGGATGAWAGHVGELATWNADEVVWDFTLPSAGTIIHVQSTSTYVAANGSGGTTAPPWKPSPTTTAGDLIKRGATDDERLPIGPNTHILTVVGGAPAWAAPAVQVMAWKHPVRVATTVAGALASSFTNGSTVDDVVLATGDRILVKDQAAGAENGLYTVNASGAPARATERRFER